MLPELFIYILSMAALRLHHLRWIVATENLWSEKLKIFTVCPFTRKFVDTGFSVSFHCKVIEFYKKRHKVCLYFHIYHKASENKFLST